MSPDNQIRLSYREYGEGDPLFILHGLFGSGDNWAGIARSLSDTFRVILPDLRNHGSSPHSPVFDYPAIIADVIGLMEELGIDSAPFIGHSMGGKAVMLLALEHPDIVEKAVIVDIAPVTYAHSQMAIIDMLLSLDLENVISRGDADSVLEPGIPSIRLRSFLLKNLKRLKDGTFTWKINLHAIKDRYHKLVSWPDTDLFVEKPMLFLKGSFSEYLLPDMKGPIEHHFPNASFIEIPDSGHWLHAEQPDLFLEAIKNFL
jgi:esterase